ncbi:MAG: amidohydrolase family protein [Desulfoprunum sp.]|jgi:hypothetical protein|uniref:amidohydrolase family protein n=1 Tax=Desulfoprunum sp. TaxID=2020866 RepID=UPI000B061098
MMLHPNMPSLHDREEASVPPDLPAVIDAHVHIFPDALFAAVRNWFDQHGWRIRYRLGSAEIIEFLLSRGVGHVIALQYAHKPGIATQLNDHMAAICRRYAGRVTGMATVFPGEEGAEELLQQAFAAGLGGLKLHAHVQCFDMNGAAMQPLYDCCRRNGKPVVMHVGREPKSEAYRCDPYVLCRARKLERVLQEFPGLKVCVPHLGLDEIAAYRELIEKYDHLWLDTTMALAGYFPLQEDIDIGRYRSDRVMYGSDFPNIPYAWDRELQRLQAARLPPRALAALLHGNAIDFFGLPGTAGAAGTGEQRMEMVGGPCPNRMT